MTVTVRSFAKINLGLRIGAKRPDGFHELRTVYQTIGLHDVLRVEVGRGAGIEIRCADPRVPTDGTNTCYRIVERAVETLQARGRVVVEIEKRLPVQGGLGGASGNAVAALLGVERALRKQLPGPERLRIAAEVGSDLPLFLVGGTVLGAGRGEEVYPLPDLASIPCVIATPEIGVSTPKAFAEWDAVLTEASKNPAAMRSTGTADWDAGEVAAETAGELRLAWTAEGGCPYVGGGGGEGARPHADRGRAKLTGVDPSDRMMELGRMVSSWLSGVPPMKNSGGRVSGVPASGRGRAETLLLDLVRTGIENDFERVVFPQHPELREVKRVLERGGAFYASLSGSGSAVYGLFQMKSRAVKAAEGLRKQGVPARATSTLTRAQYWKKFRVSGF